MAKIEATMEEIELIRQKLSSVQELIASTVRDSGRKEGSTRLVVVTKGQPIGRIESAHQAGARLFGENYPEETLPKIQALADCTGLEWHMIGHLQSRKAKIVADSFSMLQSLDSLGLAEKLDRQMAERGKILPVLLEVNVSGEESKGGWPAWDKQGCEALFPDIERILAFKNLLIQGLMIMPPLYDDPEMVRPYFRKARELRGVLVNRYPQAEWVDLSMGTSADYVVAIQEGSTILRIGTAIMGPRPPRA